LSIREARLGSLESGLIASEARLRELTQSTIPADEARLVYVQETLNVSDGAIGAGGSPGLARPPVTSEDRASPDAVTIPNPIYMELEQKLRQSQLSTLETELVGIESRLRELTFSSIPIEEKRLAALQTVLLREAPILDVPGEAGNVSPGETSDRQASGPVPSPVYLQLRQELVDAQITLAAQRAEAETLKNRVASLQREIDDLRQEFASNQERAQNLKDRVAASQQAEKIMVKLATNRQEVASLEAYISSLEDEIRQIREQAAISRVDRLELESRAARLRASHELARAELDRLLQLEPKLAAAASLSTIREPARPAAPVSPKKMRNLALSGMLGAALGAGLALFLEYYRRGSSTAFSDQR